MLIYGFNWSLPPHLPSPVYLEHSNAVASWQAGRGSNLLTSASQRTLAFAVSLVASSWQGPTWSLSLHPGARDIRKNGLRGCRATEHVQPRPHRSGLFSVNMWHGALFWCLASLTQHHACKIHLCRCMSFCCHHWRTSVITRCFAYSWRGFSAVVFLPTAVGERCRPGCCGEHAPCLCQYQDLLFPGVRVAYTCRYKYVLPVFPYGHVCISVCVHTLCTGMYVCTCVSINRARVYICVCIFICVYR